MLSIQIKHTRLIIKYHNCLLDTHLLLMAYKSLASYIHQHPPQDNSSRLDHSSQGIEQGIHIHHYQQGLIIHKMLSCQIKHIRLVIKSHNFLLNIHLLLLGYKCLASYIHCHHPHQDNSSCLSHSSQGMKQGIPIHYYPKDLVIHKILSFQIKLVRGKPRDFLDAFRLSEGNVFLFSRAACHK